MKIRVQSRWERAKTRGLSTETTFYSFHLSLIPYTINKIDKLYFYTLNISAQNYQSIHNGKWAIASGFLASPEVNVPHSFETICQLVICTECVWELFPVLKMGLRRSIADILTSVQLNWLGLCWFSTACVCQKFTLREGFRHLYTHWLHWSLPWFLPAYCNIIFEERLEI